MKKIVILVLCLLLLPITVLATDDFQTDSAITITLDGVGITLTISSGAKAEEMVVNSNSVQFTLVDSSTVVLIANDRRMLTNDLVGVSTECQVSRSVLTLPAQTTETVVIVTPSTSDFCSSGGSTGGDTTSTGGGGAAPSTPTVPTTSTGEVTATVSAGGETTLTTDENTTAGVTLPANAVSVSTNIQITNEAKDTVISSRPVPSDKTFIGGYAYDYTATANGEAVTTFDEIITLTLTYTDEQISGVDETSLRINYWKESTSEWIALSTLVFADTNTLTATTDHFTYFAIFSGLVDEEEEEVVEEEEEEEVAEEVTVVDGDLIRNPNAEGMAQFDIYIVKLVGSKKFKRLILSPHVFESYEHFDKNANGSPWDDVLDVGQTIMNQHTVSNLVRTDGDTKVYKLAPTGDTGTKQWMNMTAARFASRGYDSDSIYTINSTDVAAYIAGEDIIDADIASVETIIIKVSTLRVRSLPSLDGEILTKVNQDEVYSLLDEQDGWYKITANGVTGWCYGGDTGGYVAKQ